MEWKISICFTFHVLSANKNNESVPSSYLRVLCSTIPNNLETIWIERIISFVTINYENFTFATSAWTSSASLNCLLISPGEKPKKQNLSNIQCPCRFKALFTPRRRNLKRSFISTVRPTTHTNPSQKRSFWKTLFSQTGGIWKRRVCVIAWN